MYNYGNLSDVEFEDLCKDIMSEKLGMELRTFTKGRDSGIDICDSVVNPEVVIQVKHFFKSSFSDLRRSLKDEKTKLKDIGKVKYYICTSMGLTPGNVREIYCMFSEFMDDDHCVLGRNEIDSILNSEAGKDILTRHHKLWLTSNLMTDVQFRDALIDNSVLMDDIEEGKRYFVPTDAYRRAIRKLLEDRIVILTGNPGCGKTLTSIMIALFMTKKRDQDKDKNKGGYKIIYVSDHNIKESKALLSQDPMKKELIYLDDCFGQRYYEMKSETGKELEALIKYVHKYSNKCLLMNSRITVFREAKSRFIEFDEEIEKDRVKEVCININEITPVEKAKILYNHLYFDGVPDDYINEIKRDKRYLQIINHTNYSPRLIKRLTMKNVIKMVSPKDYFGYILKMLGEPKWIWEDEYKKGMENTDRIFINTIYSLTDGTVPSEVHRRAYDKRILAEKIDTSSAPWISAKQRLVNNMIKIVMKDRQEMLSVSDPSVNDYLDIYFKENSAEVDNIIASATEYSQFERMKPEALIDKVRDVSILNLNFPSEADKGRVILDIIVKHDIIREEYSGIVRSFFKNPSEYEDDSGFLLLLNIYLKLLQADYDKAYHTKSYLNGESVKSLLLCADLDEVNDFFSKVSEYGLECILKLYKTEIFEALVNVMAVYIITASLEDYYDENVYELIKEYTTYTEYGVDTDIKGAAQVVQDNFRDALYDDVLIHISDFPTPFNDGYDIIDLIKNYEDISFMDIESDIESAMERDYDEDYFYEVYKENKGTDVSISEVDRIFR